MHCKIILHKASHNHSNYEIFIPTFSCIASLFDVLSPSVLSTCSNPTLIRRQTRSLINNIRYYIKLKTCFCVSSKNVILGCILVNPSPILFIHHVNMVFRNSFASVIFFNYIFNIRFKDLDIYLSSENISLFHRYVIHLENFVYKIDRKSKFSQVGRAMKNVFISKK